MIRVTLGFVMAFGAATQVMAGHANPWATDDDVVKEQYHDVNQARSIGTPGEDEMRGNMYQNVSSHAGGGFGGAAPQDGTGYGRGVDTAGGSGGGAGRGGGGRGGNH